MTQTHREDWFLAQLKPNGLSLALRNLARQGFVTFVPLERRTIRRGGRFVTDDLPAFPGYVFVRFDRDAGRWRVINSTQGIARLVSFGTTPAPVPAELMAALIARYAAPEDSAQIALAEGQEVVLREGPFADFIGRIDTITPDQRVFVLIDLMGRVTRMAVDKAALRAAD